jgi:hypothetical protein
MWRMPTDQFSPEQAGQPEQRLVRDVADGYVLALADLDPILATMLGLHPGEHRLPDYSPDGQAAADALARTALAELAAARPAGSAAQGIPAAPAAGPAAANGDGGDERRCARLLRERLEAGLARSAAGEPLRSLSNIFGPLGVPGHAHGHRGRLGGDRPADGRGARGAGRDPGLAGRGGPARAAGRAAAGPHRGRPAAGVVGQRGGPRLVRRVRA